MNLPRLARRWRLLLLAGLIRFWSFPAHSAEEDALLDLWKQQMVMPDDHVAAEKACEDFIAAHPADPLLPVVRGIEAWHRLRSGRRSEGLQTLAADLIAPPGTVKEGARRLAQAWLTRADRDQLAAALQAYYGKQVAYPKSLEQLPAAAHPILNDRFGKAWNYRLTGFAKIPGFTDQKYALESPVLGELSDFNKALKLPYGARILAAPVEMSAAPANAPAVKFDFSGKAAMIGMGQAVGDLYLAFAGARIVVVCDYLHWKVFPRP